MSKGEIAACSTFKDCRWELAAVAAVGKGDAGRFEIIQHGTRACVLNKCAVLNKSVLSVAHVKHTVGCRNECN